MKDVDMVPNLSPQNVVSIDIGKDFMLKHGYINKKQVDPNGRVIVVCASGARA